MKVAVVAVGYNRPDSMEKLLLSIIDADYEKDEVDLIVSIDKGERQDEIVHVAEKLKWEYGKKNIRKFSERQGLREHIIQCGDLTEIYDAIIVLEDDLVVSKWYYSYVKQMIYAYKDDSRIAGISLYKHQIHPGVCRPFEPVNNGYDVFFMQFAMSWGQCWTRSMWRNFKAWYEKNKEADLSVGNILPKYIANWNQQSWLKYYMRYIVETNRYFVYPYFALSTNASDVGEHCRIPNNDYQIALLQGKLIYRIPSFEETIKYDIFFERQEIDPIPEIKGRKILDLYGSRSVYENANYIISTSSLPYKVVMSFQLKYRPIEMNVLNPSEGQGGYVYDVSEPQNKKLVNTDIITRYDVRAIHWKKLLHLGWNGFREAVRERLKR